MHPAQFASCGQLLRPQRDRKDDFGLAQLFLNAVVAVAERDLELREFLRQPLGKPSRHLPQIKPVMHHDQQLHIAKI
jgi:hypothetical protein